MSPVRAPDINKKPTLSPTAKRRVRWYSVVLAAVILLIGWWFLWRPVWHEYRALPNLDGYISAKHSITNELASLGKLTSEYRELTVTDRKRLELALPQGPDIPNLLAQFEGMAKATNFTLDDITFNVDKPMVQATSAAIAAEPVSNSVSYLKVNVVIRGGGYDDLKKFIAAAEESLRLLKLTSLTFTTKTQGQQGIVYNLSFHTAYVPK